MKKALLALVLGLSLAACPLTYFLIGPSFDETQLATFKLLLITALSSGLLCFILGEITLNNSQMDKLWSVLPAVYVWITAIRGGMSARLVVMAVLVTLWGARLTFNFARKGAYSIKFWTGKEDYRWEVLRDKKEFKPRWKWSLFNFFFISVYQNLLVLAITLPALACMTKDTPFGIGDIAAAVLFVFFLIYETVADEQQWRFQTKKWEMINGGKTLSELPSPYNRGFNTTGLWAFSRHPNYLGEQGVWAAFYIFTIGAGLIAFNWSVAGAILLIVLFLGSSSFAEEISSSKYPEYAEYRKKVWRYFPFAKYGK